MVDKNGTSLLIEKIDISHFLKIYVIILFLIVILDTQLIGK